MREIYFGMQVSFTIYFSILDQYSLRLHRFYQTNLGTPCILDSDLSLASSSQGILEKGERLYTMRVKRF